ncbi:MAG: carboxypeptidase-like regulatory domain-containing protein, partial [Acidobacteriota bacterium]
MLIIGFLFVGVSSWGGAAAAAQGLDIVGQVVDAEDGRAVAGAAVSLLEPLSSSDKAELYDDGEIPRVIVDRTAADDGGEYRLDAPEIGVYVLAIEAPGYSPVFRHLSPWIEGTALAPARLQPAAERTITVVEADGQPVPGVAAELFSERKRVPRHKRMRHNGWWPLAVHAVGDDDGRMQLPFAPADVATHRLRIAAPGYAPVELEPEGAGALRIQLEAGTPRDVRVLDAAGRAVDNVLVRSGALPLGRSDEDGRLTVRVGDRSLTIAAEIDDDGGRERGWLSISATEPATGDGTTAQEPPAEPEDPEELILALETIEVIDGAVVEAEGRRPIPGALVVATGAGKGFVIADQAGRYTVDAGTRSLR